jgi:hypothetical protein
VFEPELPILIITLLSEMPVRVHRPGHYVYRSIAPSPEVKNEWGSNFSPLLYALIACSDKFFHVFVVLRLYICGNCRFIIFINCS